MDHRLRTAAVTVALITGSGLADTLQVPGDHATIQAAVDAAMDGDTVLVGDGTWVENVSVLNKTLVMAGASDDATLCAIEGATAALTVDGAAGLVSVTGITLSGAGLGSGLSVGADASVSLERCVITDAATSGVVMAGETLTMTGCTISACSNADHGGGLRASAGHVTMTGCTITGNVTHDHAGHGGGIHFAGDELVLTGCAVAANTLLGTGAQGAGMYAIECTITILGTEFRDNAGAIEGGAMNINTVHATIRNASICDNTSHEGGGINAVWDCDVTLTDTLLSGNTAQFGAGGALRSIGATLRVHACTIADNTTLTGGSILASSGDTTMTNTVAGLNSAPGFSTSGTVDATYCNIPEGLPGTGNITTAPVFVDAPAGDFRLAAGSAAIDAGNGPAYVGLGVDCNGNPRVVDDPATPGSGIAVVGTATIDMGAFEYQPDVDDEPDTCPADVTGDGVVNVQDLVELIVVWGVCP